MKKDLLIEKFDATMYDVKYDTDNVVLCRSKLDSKWTNPGETLVKLKEIEESLDGFTKVNISGKHKFKLDPCEVWHLYLALKHKFEVRKDGEKVFRVNVK